VSLGCAAKKPVVPKPPDLSGLEQADAAVLQGCYDCLLDARAIYRRIGAGAGRPVVLTRLFETSLLLALRDKELDLDPSEPIAEAQALARELPPDVEADRYLALVDVVPPDDVGVPRKTMTAFRRARATSPLVLKLNDELAWLKTGVLRAPVRDYLDLAVDCAYPNRPSAPGQPARPMRLDVRQPTPGAPPLVAYRTAICVVLNQPVLYRLREDNPRFVEASLFLARFDIAVADQMGPGRAVDRLEEARARFPASPSASYLSGSINQAIGDCDAALAFYDETLALAPAHENALLGRTICLSYLKHPVEAIQTATRMIELQTDNTGEAYYWRAWNRYHAQLLELARTDIESAKRGFGGVETFTLAGEIAYEQNDLDPAEQNLRTARVMASGDTNCEAIWYLALVQTKRQGWLGAARFFEEAMTCYEATSDMNQRMLTSFQARLELEATFRARKIASLEATVKELTSQRYASALNAANYYATGGSIPPAKRLVEIAATDPALAEKVAKLREWLKDK
jgi:tetratricopeptide (TPR) repeat protein